MNFKERNFLVKTIRQIPRQSIVVEVGSWNGGSALTMMIASIKARKNIRFYFIDPWRYEDGSCAPELVEKAKGRDIKHEFDIKLYPFVGKYKAIQDWSVNAAKKFLPESIDMVFLDGDHSYDAVCADIEAWFPKLRSGGIMCGHDFGRSEYGVTDAVYKYFDKEVVKNPARSIWKVKRGDVDLTKFNNRSKT